MSHVTHTTYKRPGSDSYPSNLVTGSDWNRLKRSLGKPSIAATMRYAAGVWGGAFFVRADGSLRVLTARPDGSQFQRTHKPGTWGWA